MWHFCQNQYSGSQTLLPVPHLFLLFLAAYLHVSFPAGKVNKWVCLVRVLFAKVLSWILLLLLFLPAQPTTLETPGARFLTSSWQQCLQTGTTESCVAESLHALALIHMESPCQKRRMAWCILGNPRMAWEMFTPWEISFWTQRSHLLPARRVGTWTIPKIDTRSVLWWPQITRWENKAWQELHCGLNQIRCKGMLPCTACANKCLCMQWAVMESLSVVI